MTTLYRYSRRDAALGECLAAAAAKANLQGYCHSPRWTRFATCDDKGQLAFVPRLGSPDSEALDQVYEARFFCEAAELRWLRDPDGTGNGQAAWVSEAEGAPEGFMPLEKPLDRLTDLEILKALETRIAIQPRAELPGIDPGKRGAYRLREYIGLAPGQAGADGNCMLVEQRILGIAPWTEKENNDD
jgi:hypothetical protein